MKKCPFCSEEIQDEAIKCRWCGSELKESAVIGAPGSVADESAGSASSVVPHEAPGRTGAPRFSHYGHRYLLGSGADYYGIWDRETPGPAAHKFPHTDEGWRAAWSQFSSLEPNGVAASKSDENLRLGSQEQGKIISSFVEHRLPLVVRNEAATLPALKQQEFLEEYMRRKRKLFWAYVCWFFFPIGIFFALHYVYLKKWGLGFLFMVTGAGLGIWWIVDAFRLPGMVRDYNRDVAIDVMRDMKAISTPNT